MERAYTVFLDIVLMLVPFCLMTGSYAQIMHTLCADIQDDSSISQGIYVS